jgi:alkanesulfonate monooxygenase SsuD/methylene tetrahydromethanopterin reductase-like flavin-dependent oxidoreductase (luciferase family)
VIVGGSAGPRSAALAARFADEYNTIYVTPGEARERRAALDRACEAEGRDPATLRFSLMNGFLVGADEADLHARARQLAHWRGHDATDPAAYVAALPPWIVGTPDAIVARLREYEAAGVERVMLQHHLFGDMAALELIGREVIPALAT